MERLTEEDWKERLDRKYLDINYIKLAEYEDTGLTPEEIKDILSVLSENQDDVDEDGISTGLIHDLLELARYRQAEEQGLLIKFPPCEVGDIIFEVDRPEYGIIYCEVTRIYFVKGYVCGVKSNGKFSQTIIEVSVVDGHGKGSAYHFTDDEFGKLVYFTREAAEEALKGSVSIED